jgi:tyrosyl-tRNA synthetase
MPCIQHILHAILILEFTYIPPMAKTEEQLNRLARITDEIYSLDELRVRLASGKPLRIKYGVDVTAPFLHIGHAVNLWAMRQLQDDGHKVVFLIGDFTTRIGDPTGKSETRKVMPREVIEENAKEFIKQVSLVLDTDKKVFEVRRNSEWYDKMSLSEFLALLSMVTHSKLIQRDMFQKRISEQREIFMHEMIYPILQGYDSYMLESDLTIVGSDQLFNELMGRFYQEKFGQKPQVVMTTKITPGLDGVEKQSKSLGNYIAISDSPEDKFGKTMSIPDKLILPYFEVYTETPMERLSAISKKLASGNLNPMDAKKDLAEAIVARYHGTGIAAKTRSKFENVFQKGEIPEDSKIFKMNESTYSTAGLLVATGAVSTKSEAKRVIEQGGVDIGGQTYKDPKELISSENVNDKIMRVGKKRFIRLVKP